MSFKGEELKEWIVEPLKSYMRFEYVTNYLYNVLTLLETNITESVSQLSIQLFHSSDNFGDITSLALKQVWDVVTTGGYCRGWM